MNKNIAILGCPRSGTSLVAHLVKSAGYDADNYGTRDLMKPNKDFNPDGYFERIDIVKTNDRLIHLIGENYNFLNPPTLHKVKANNNISQGCEELSNELNAYSGWFIKDSRLAFTLNLYKLKNVHIIKVIRNPQSVKQSMIRHYGNLFEQDVKHGPHKVKQGNFNDYYKNINQCIDWQASLGPSITVTYENIINGKVEELQDFLGNKVDKTIINPSYRNYEM